MSTAVIDGNARRWKAGVSKRTHGDAHRLIVTVFGVEDGRPANWAEPEYELGSLIPPRTYSVAVPKTLNGPEKLASAAKTLPVLCWHQAVANAHASRFAFDFNAQLSAGARGCPRRH